MKTRTLIPVVAVLFAAFTIATQITAQADSFGSEGNTFTLDFVIVGNPDNVADTRTMNDSTTAYGAVPYGYRIGKYEISQDAIDKATASGMSNVTAGAWTGSQPAADISWYEAAAFVNWLNMSRGFQPAYNLVRTNGAWNMVLWNSDDAWQAGGENLYRHKDAHYFIPSENEWYKAAYYNPAGSNYFLFATASDSAPIPVASGTNAGTAVYGNLTTAPAAVDSAGGLSAYGTMAQGGNVFEWTESAVVRTNDTTTRSRVIRGGNWLNIDTINLKSSTRLNFGPSDKSVSRGFRVASRFDTDGDGVNDYREFIDGTDPTDPSSFNPLSIGLVAHYPFDGNANDESGFNSEAQNGDIAPSASTQDDLRPSFSFDGGSSSYSLVSGIPIPTNNAFSWSVWIKPEILKPRNFLLSRIDRLDGDSSPWLEIDGEGRVRFARANKPETQYELLSEDGATQTGAWSHVVAVSDSSGRRQLFINGLPAAEGVDLVYGEEHPLLLIGADRYLSGHPTHAPGLNANFQGKISSVRVYNRALSPIEAAQLYINDMACMTIPNSGLTVAADFLTSFGLQRYSSGAAEVAENPNAFGFFTEGQFEDNRAAGRLDVITSPMTFGLYDSDSIMDLRMDGLMIQKQGGSATVFFQPQTTTDLATQPFTNNGTAITNEIPMPGDKGFLRIQAKPE
jgi:formylglycine-generating enzyme required for sulfatase activity